MAYVSTGQLPPLARVQALVSEAHQRFSAEPAGAVSNVYPALASMNPDLFGVCVASVDGSTASAGDAATPFTIMSVSKPFVFALVANLMGTPKVRTLIGANATGLPFNSITAMEQSPGGRTNPMVNPGAIATTSYAPDWTFLHNGLSAFAGRPLDLDEEVLASARASNHRNRALAALLASYGLLGGDYVEALDLYTRQCSLLVTATDLAVMSATLAHGGVNPVTREQVVAADACHAALAVMTTAGLYETSGDWLYTVGLPGKSGVGGGIVTVSPGKGGLGTFAPRLDAAGNSVKGQLAAAFLSRELGLDLFFSSPRR